MVSVIHSLAFDLQLSLAFSHSLSLTPSLSFTHSFLPEASFGLQVLSFPASVCLCDYQSVCQSLACPRDNSGPVQARITKFGPRVQNNLIKVPTVLWSDRPWPSRSNLRSNSKFTPLWACLHHNSPPIQARITKFEPEVQNTLVLEFGGAIDLDLQGQI